MDCTITSSGANRTARCRGVTLVELMVAIAIGGIAMAAVMSFTLFSARSFAAVTNYVDLDMRSRSALDRMSQEIRQSDGLATNGYSATQLVFNGKDPVTSAPYILTYAYDPVGKKLTRTKDGESQVLLTQCISNNWYMYKRNMTNGTDHPMPTDDPNQCKLIQLTWVCSRDILGKSANTESVQSAEIVIRKK